MGGNGADILQGGIGIDVLTGGEGADHFVYRTLGEIGRVGGERIEDFAHSDGDLIDVAELAPRATTFAFIGADPFSGGSDGPELRAISDGDGGFLIQGDANGDGRDDFTFTVVADQPLVAADFVL